MKKILLASLVLGLALSNVNAQTAPATTAPAAKTATTKTTTTKTATAKPALEVPDVVKNKFAADYPAIKDAKWQKSGNADYAAIYKEGGKGRRIVYAADGSLVRTRIDQDASSLPASVNDYVAKNYAGQKVSSAEQVTEKGKSWYEVKVGENKLKFDSNGNIVTPKAKKAAAAPAPAGK